MSNFLAKINGVILNPLITLGFALALIYFLIGVFQFVSNGDDPEARKTGGEHIFYGVIGMFIMMAVFGIIRLLLNTFGIPIPSSIR